MSCGSSSKINVKTITPIASFKTEEESFLERRITLATEGFTTKFCESILRDRNRLSKENAMVVAEYAIAMKREVNPRPSYLKYTIQYLSELSRRVGLEKRFKDDMTREDIRSNKV